MIGVEKDKVILVEYNDNWKNEFIEIKSNLLKILGNNVIEIHHIGSTAIKGIVAKPIMDINVIIQSKELLNIKGMEEAGYLYKGDYETFGQLFEYGVKDNIVTQHVKCYLENNKNHNDVVLFCEFLNKNSEYAKQYNDLKIELAMKYPDNRVE